MSGENELLGLRTGLKTYEDKPKDFVAKDRAPKEEEHRERAPRQKKQSHD
jgi:hypothetical protein